MDKKKLVEWLENKVDGLKGASIDTLKGSLTAYQAVLKRLTNGTFDSEEPKHKDSGQMINDFYDRFELAKHAMRGLLENSRIDHNKTDIASVAIKIADEMIKQLNGEST